MTTAAYSFREPLTPELVLVLPKGLADLARARLPEPGAFAPPSAPQDLGSRPAARLARAGELAAVYLACFAFTVTPFILLAASRNSQGMGRDHARLAPRAADGPVSPVK